MTWNAKWHADADADTRSMTPSRNTRIYTLRSVPSSPGRSFFCLGPRPIAYLDGILIDNLTFTTMNFKSIWLGDRGMLNLCKYPWNNDTFTFGLTVQWPFKLSCVTISFEVCSSSLVRGRCRCRWGWWRPIRLLHLPSLLYSPLLLQLKDCKRLDLERCGSEHYLERYQSQKILAFLGDSSPPTGNAIASENYSSPATG